GHEAFHGTWEEIVVDLQQPGRALEEGLARHAAMAIRRSLVEHGEKSRGKAPRIARLAAETRRETVGCTEVHALDLAGEWIRVGPQPRDRLRPEHLGDTRRTGRPEAVLGEEQHDVSQALLRRPALADPLHPGGRQAGKAGQALGFLVEHTERVAPEG